MARTSRLQKLWHAVRKRVISLFIFENGDIRQTVFLAGTGRGGTTWVSNLINYDGAFRYVFEPFRPSRVPAVRSFSTRQYLRPENREARFLEPARAVLSGRVKNRWVDGHNARLWVQRRLIKDIRTNLLLKWMRTHFPAVPVVLLVRHPCATALSRTQMGWPAPLGLFLEQEALMDDHLAPFAALLRSASGTSASGAFEQHLLMWCVENYVPLRQFAPGEVHLAFYERFHTDAEAETRRLFAHVGRRFDPAACAALERPSATARREGAVHTGRDPLTDWQRQLSASQKARAAELLARFRLDRLYTAGDPLPRLADRAEAFAPHPS